jgi:hypothetical protein
MFAMRSDSDSVAPGRLPPGGVDRRADASRRRWLASAAAWLGLAGLAGLVALPGAPAVAQAYSELKWEALVPPDWDPLKDFKDFDGGSVLSDSDPRAQAMYERLRQIWDEAPTVAALDGQRVRLPGFVVPLDEAGRGLGSFLLVPYFGACIHTPPPPANQIVHVVASRPVEGFRSMDAVWVQGVLRTVRHDSGMGVSSYRLEASGVERYVEKTR